MEGRNPRVLIAVIAADAGDLSSVHVGQRLGEPGRAVRIEPLSGVSQLRAAVIDQVEVSAWNPTGVVILIRDLPISLLRLQLDLERVAKKDRLTGWNRARIGRVLNNLWHRSLRPCQVKTAKEHSDKDKT